jgi:hypothetical protein
MLFFFLDDIISKGYRNAQLKEEDLYPLCDTDASEHLRAQSFPVRCQYKLLSSN